MCPTGAQNPSWKADRHLYLSGFMGSGKSSVGRILARRLGISFVDLDHYIEEQAGLRIREIFARHGEQTFRKCELQALQALSAQSGSHPKVVSLGGGAVMSSQCREILSRTGVWIYLRARVATLEKRLKHSPTERPLIEEARLQGEQGDQAALSSRISTLLEERKQYYEQASLKVDVDGLSPAGVASLLVRKLGRMPTRGARPEERQ